MFKSFERLVSLFNFKLNTLSLYGDTLSYNFLNKNNKNIKYRYKPNLKIPYEENYKVKGKMPKIKNTL